MAQHILVVEDEPAISEMIQIALQKADYRVTVAERVADAKVVLADDPVDLLLIDWMLPGASGIELVRHLRQEELTRHLPAIMLTAKSDENDISAGLDAGADDYVVKPFSPRELNSRIKALLRRSSAFAGDVVKCGTLVCDSASHRVTAGDTEIDLGHTEFKLLQFLMNNPDRVYSRAQLLDNVWGQGTFIEERTVDVHILRLRKALKPSGLADLIQTVRGAGYRLSES